MFPIKAAMYTKATDILAQKGAVGLAKEAKRLGFSGVELIDLGRGLPFRDAAEAKECRAILAEAGLSVVCVSATLDLFTDPMYDGRIAGDLAFCEALGTPYFHHTVFPYIDGRKAPASFAEMLPQSVEKATEIAKKAEAAGFSCIYEEQGYIFNGIECFGRFFETVKGNVPSVGVCGDCGNALFASVEPIAFLRRFLTEIRHVHLKDYRVEENAGCLYAKDGTPLTEVKFGEGICHLEECVSLLRSAGYDGWYSFENNYDGDFEEGVAAGMKFLDRNP